MSRFKLSLLLSLLFFSGPGASEVIIGSKSFSESFILAEIASILIEDKLDIKTDVRLGLGGTQVAYGAIEKKAIQIYPEYTGTLLSTVLKEKAKGRNPKQIWKDLNQWLQEKTELQILAPLGFNNTYAVGVLDSDPRFKEVRKVSELPKDLSDYVVGMNHEFLEREDGFAHFVRAYGFEVSANQIQSLESGLTYSALKNGQTDLVMAYSTDGRIGSMGIRLLEDDRNFFPVYEAVFLVHRDLIEELPQIAETLNLIAGQISEVEMIQMNDQVDGQGRRPRDVAKNWLIQKGLIKGTLAGAGDKNTDSIFTFFWQRRAELWSLLVEHCVLSFGALLIALLISIPTGIILTRFQAISQPVFFVINALQTIPSLALLGFLVPLMGIGFWPALVALFIYSLLPLVRNTYAGVIGVDPFHIEVASGLGMTNLQILRRVEIPLALPFIFAGARTATVIGVGTATLASLIGAGGFGGPIFRGISTLNTDLIFLGAIPAAILALVSDHGIGWIERKMISPGIQS